MTPSRPPESTRTVTALLEEKAAKLEGAVMMEYGDKQFTYSEWKEQVQAMAGGLRNVGIDKGDHVAILAYNSPEWLLVGWATALLGGVVIPVDTRFKGSDLSFVLNHSDPDLIVFDSHTRDAYEEVKDEVKSTDTELYIGQGNPAQSYRHVSDFKNRGSMAQIDPTIRPDDPLTITYVQRAASEQPLGVTLPHYAFINSGWEMCHNILDLSSDDRVFTTLPMYSCFSQHTAIIGPMLVEAPFAFAWRFEPEDFWKQVRSHEATVVVFLGRMLSVLNNRKSDTPDDANPLRYAVGRGSDEMLIDEFEQRFDCTVLECYGVAESASLVTSNRPGHRQKGSVGVSLSYTEVAVVDETDQPVSAEETGEVVVRPTRPHTMMTEYYKEPERTLETFRNLWLHTGDIGYKDENGVLYYIDDQHNTIRRLAGSISSLEIESVLQTHPGIADATIVAVESPTGGDEIKAVVVPEDGSSLTPMDIQTHCKGRLAYHKLPRYITIVESLPKSPSGKISKEELRKIESDWDREAGYTYFQ